MDLPDRLPDRARDAGAARAAARRDARARGSAAGARSRACRGASLAAAAAALDRLPALLRGSVLRRDRGCLRDQRGHRCRCACPGTGGAARSTGTGRGDEVIDASDRLLADRFARLGVSPDDSDWLDVRRRARRHRRRWVVVLVAAAFGALIVGSAFGLYREVVDFFSAERAPEPVVVDFRQMSVRGTIGLGPQVVPGEARSIPLEELGGKRGVLYRAPTKDGGFCWRWENGGSCGRTPDLAQSPLGVLTLEGPGGGPAQISGHLLDRAIDRLALEYEDGARDEIPFVWVTAPIHAGLFAPGGP